MFVKGQCFQGIGAKAVSSKLFLPKDDFLLDTLIVVAVFNITFFVNIELQGAFLHSLCIFVALMPC